MLQGEAIAKAYEILEKLIEGFLDETKEFKIENDTQVLEVVRELGVHCGEYSARLKGAIRSEKEEQLAKAYKQIPISRFKAA
jgi:hypothetical protein